MAQAEIDEMIDLCEEFDPNTVLTVARELTEAGVKEAFRAIEGQTADLGQFAVHGDLDEEPRAQFFRESLGTNSPLICLFSETQIKELRL